MDKATARLINAIAYRARLAQDLPQLEARLLALLEDGQSLQTRRWIATRERGALSLRSNGNPSRLHQLPLERLQD